MPEHQLCILLVEDEEAHAELVRRAFEPRGDAVRLAVVTTLAEARACLDTQSARPDLIIADWRLPDGEGLDLLSGKGDSPGVPTVIMTSYGNERIAVEAMKAGAIDYIVKSETTLLDMPHIAERAIRQYQLLAERARMENVLRESEGKFRSFIEQSSEGVALLDEQGNVIEWNLAQANIWGVGWEQVEGKPFWEVQFSVTVPERKTPERFEYYRTIILDALRTGQSPIFNRPIEAEICQPNGERRFIEQTIFPIATNNGYRIGSVTRDVSQRWRAEEALKHAHSELVEAYDATIEGWSRAMDLRDSQTTGHSMRVAEMTVRLGRALGMSEDKLVHVWRGALLHDMGKMAIPDHILQKPSILTDAEWQVMRRHPEYAREMLLPIRYLGEALEVPIYHHERWDGTGYPRGLKGEGIPVGARIFAVVDVWDALTSERPYRKKWRPEDATEYLRANRGKQFDPQIVDAFLKLLGSEWRLD